MMRTVIILSILLFGIGLAGKGGKGGNRKDGSRRDGSRKDGNRKNGNEIAEGSANEATIRYVNVNFEGASTGEFETPYKTIQACVDDMKKGDECHIR